MKQGLKIIPLLFVIIISIQACSSSMTKDKNVYYLGHWYFLDYSSNDSVPEYGEILFTDSTFRIAFISAGFGPTGSDYKIRNDSIFIGGYFNYIMDKIDRESFKLKYNSSENGEFNEMIVKRLGSHEFELKEQFADFEELDNYFENAFKRSKKYIDQGNND